METKRTLAVLLEDELSLVVVSLVLSTSAVLSSLFEKKVSVPSEVKDDRAEGQRWPF